VVMWDPHGLPLQVGLLFVAAGAFCNALGAILMKRVAQVGAIQFQAWVAVSSLPVMLGLSLLVEHDQIAAIKNGLPYFLGGVAFNALVVSVGAHTTYYWLIRRYDMSLLAPLTLMNPILIVVFGVWLTHDPFGPRMALGVAATLVGVLIITVQPNRWLALLSRVRSKP
jgi:O-acetylserine/cysteine efflux transporter